MKKKVNKFTKFLLLIAMIFSDLISPISALAATNNEPTKGDVGINSNVSNNGQSTTVSVGSLANEGDIEVTKTVSKRGDGIYNVEFEVKGKDYSSTTTSTKPIYAVVVFDRSSSMKENKCVESFLFVCTRYQEIKFSSAVAGAKTFADTLLGRFSNAQLALIGFDTNVTLLRDFANSNFDSVSFGSPEGVTNLTGALNMANTKLSSISNDYTKYVVVISDGEPTNSNGYVTDDAKAQAISAAQTLKDNGVTIFSLGYETTTSAANVLKRVASGNDYYADANPDTVAGKFSEITSSITTSVFAGTNAVLTDYIGENFTVVDNDNITINADGSVSANIGNITEGGTKVSFDVEIDQDNAEGWVNTNEGFKLVYDENPDGIVYSANESQPQVYWERNQYTYTVNYYNDKISENNKIGSFEGTSYNGEKITLNEEQKNAYKETGYELSNSNNYSVVIDKDSDNVINVLYEKKNLKYNIKHFFENDNNSYTENTSLREENNTASYGDKINAIDKYLENIPVGYVEDETKTKENNDGIYTITENGTDVNVYYKKQELSYNVIYLFEELDGTYAQRSDVKPKSDSTKYGNEVDLSKRLLSTTPNGFVFNSGKTYENNNGVYVITENNTNLYVYYNRANNLNMNVNYYFNGEFDKTNSYSNAIYGMTVSASDYALEKVDSEYLSNKENTDSEDYFLDPNNSNNSSNIVIGADNNNMNLYYISTTFKDNAEEVTKSSNTEKVTTSNQKIDYTITYKNTINNVREGDVITVTITDTLPFEIDEDNSNLISDGVKGVYDKRSKTITWTFNETADEFTSVYNIEKIVSFTVVYKDFEYISSTDNNKLINTANGITKVNNNSTDGSTSDSEEILVEIKGNLEVTYKAEDGTVLAQSKSITDLAGTHYTTKAEDIFGYTLKEEPSNKEGTILANQTITVNYVYTKNDGKITDGVVTKVGAESVDSVDDVFNYTVTYNGKVSEYVGKATLTVTDNLPFAINEKELRLDTRCTYNSDNNTLVCTVEYDITEETEISETFELSLVYVGVDTESVTNSVDSKLVLEDSQVEDNQDDDAETVVNKGTVITKYVDTDGNEIAEKESSTGLVGTKYITYSKNIEGYALVSDPENKEGTYTEEDIEVTYVYEKMPVGNGDGDVEILPPQTGVESNNIFMFIKYIAMALVFFLIERKTKNSIN